MSDMMADLGEETSPILELLAKSFTVDGDHQRTVRHPRSHEFDGLLGFRNAIWNIEFQGPFGVLQIAHVNGPSIRAIRTIEAALIRAGTYRKSVENDGVFRPRPRLNFGRA